MLTIYFGFHGCIHAGACTQLGVGMLEVQEVQAFL